jgi:hypothetical protein
MAPDLLLARAVEKLVLKLVKANHLKRWDAKPLVRCLRIAGLPSEISTFAECISHGRNNFREVLT